MHSDSKDERTPFQIEYEKKYGKGPFLAADLVFTWGYLILLVTRHDGSFALPGGFVNPGESTREAAIRECKEETNIDPLRHMCRRNPLIFCHPDRDPRGHIISIVHRAEKYDHDYGNLPHPVGSDDVDDAQWYPLYNLRMMENQFYADHFKIITKSLWNKENV